MPRDDPDCVWETEPPPLSPPAPPPVPAFEAPLETRLLPPLRARFALRRADDKSVAPACTAAFVRLAAEPLEAGQAFAVPTASAQIAAPARKIRVISNLQGKSPTS